MTTSARRAASVFSLLVLVWLALYAASEWQRRQIAKPPRKEVIEQMRKAADEYSARK